jgi:tetratricopeptide (TPR) repeat protein/DNA-binding winged helix-turn-helix (wHTH) protein
MSTAAATPETSASGRIFRFGAFEFHLHARELRKRGLRIKLSGQPVSVLAMLLERPGEVITRDELQRQLWPAGTYVDFEHGVNAAVKRLRQALGDSADSPRFVETVARNGYRFIAPVSQSVGGLTQAPDQSKAEASQPAAPTHQVAPSRHFRPLPVLIVGIMLVTVIAGGLALLQSDIRQTIADEIRVALIAPDRARLARRHIPASEAYLAYSKGRFFWNRRTEADLKIAIGYFQQAVEKDPDYALAYDGLADCWAPLGWYAYMAPSETFPHAKAAVMKALALDDSLAEAHTSLAFVSLYYDRDWAKAEREFRRAIDLNPNYANGHHWYAEFLSLLERHEEAIAESERARELDPLSNIINTWVGSRYFFARQYDRAIEQYRNAIEMDPGFVPVHLVLGHALEQKHMHQEAIVELERAVDLSGGSPVYIASLAHAYGSAGRRSEARKLLDDLRKLSKQRYVSFYDLALACLAVGDADQAFALLDRGIEERSPRVAFLGVDPRFDSLRSDARFKALMIRIGRPS